jgi:hypothetical protein
MAGEEEKMIVDTLLAEAVAKMKPGRLVLTNYRVFLYLKFLDSILSNKRSMIKLSIILQEIS